MIFDKNQTEFKDIIQEGIWEIGTRQVPLETTLPFIPEELKAACEDLHKFTNNLLADMYESPDSFGLEVNHSKSDEENKEQSKFYFNFLTGIFKLKGMILVGNNYEIPLGAFQKYIKKFDFKIIDSLKRHGLTCEEKSDTVIVYNSLYPAMLTALKSMAEKAKENYKYNVADYILYNDFRGLVNYKRTFEDSIVILNDKNREIAQMLHDYCISHNALPRTCLHYSRVAYAHKTKIVKLNPLLQGLVYTFEIGEKNQLVIHVEAGREAFQMLEEKILLIEQEAEKFDDPEGFKELWRNTLRQCKGCSNGKPCWHWEKCIEVFGKKIIVCQDHLTISNPDEKILKHILQLIDFRIRVLSEGVPPESISWPNYC